MSSDRTTKCDLDSAAETLKKAEGFTMIEVILAISIFAIGILAIASMQASAVKTNSSASKLTERTALAQDRLERLVALPYTSPWLESAGNFPNVDTNGNTHQQTIAGGYTVTWNVTDNNPITGSKYLTVTVTRGTKSSRMVGIKSQLIQ